MEKRIISLENRVALLEKQLNPAKQSPREMLLKEWAAGEAARCSVTIGAIYNRLNRGQYPWLRMRRKNQRVVFVLGNGDLLRQRVGI